jgi:hypothetical protein
VSSLALNLFDIINSNPIEHFLLPILLAFLDVDWPHHRSSEGFVDSNLLISELQNWSFTQAATEHALRRANNKKLVETPQRVTFAENGSGLHGDMPPSFRITTIGAYHLKRWIAEFAYLDAMAYDTPILDEAVRKTIAPNINSLAIEHRYERALTFRSYITKAWQSSTLKPRYFDWTAMLPWRDGPAACRAISPPRRSPDGS